MWPEPHRPRRALKPACEPIVDRNIGAGSIWLIEAAGKPTSQETIMRRIILIAASAIFSLGAAHAYAIGGRNLNSEQSPYALIAPQAAAPVRTNEGRAAYRGFSATYQSPSDMMSSPNVYPEDTTRYSRGR
jgi:hypothetical protein